MGAEAFALSIDLSRRGHSIARESPVNKRPRGGFTAVVSVRENSCGIDIRTARNTPFIRVGDISFDHRDIRRGRRLMSMPVTRSSYITRLRCSLTSEMI